MPRIRRVVEVGVPHHITQRGNNRQNIFLSEVDYQVYLRLLRNECRRYGMRLLGYCLMTNHIHLVAIPDQPDSLACAIGRAHVNYTQLVNRRHRRAGHLWQSRYYSCPLGRQHLRLALAYVDLNPLRAGLVERAVDYKWSSASAHVTAGDSQEMLDIELWQEFCPLGD